MLTMSHINDRMGEWKMSYSFENKKIDEHIQTYTVYQVDKCRICFWKLNFHIQEVNHGKHVFRYMRNIKE